MNVDKEILIFAFRYALGRKSTAVPIVAENLKRNWNKLSEFDKKQIKNEIKSAIKQNKAGMKMDVQIWTEILNLK